MESSLNTNQNRMSYFFGRRVLNYNVPANRSTLETTRTKKPLDSSSYTSYRKNVAIIKARS